MDDLLAQVRRAVRRYGLFAHGQAVVVGVSGGPDSLCLLHLLDRLAPELALRLHVAHLHHGLRGAEADADARFVADLAEQWGLPCTVGRVEVAALAQAAGVSLEEAARDARYRFLDDVAAAVGAGTVAVGHNADDQAETVLMHFLRGSGGAGLRGMTPRTRLGQLDLVRPLLWTPRTEIVAYCTQHGLAPRFDRSNEDTTFFRNRLRHELLPILETYNPAIRPILAHTADVLAGDHELLQAALAAAWATVETSATGEMIQLDLLAWRGLPLALQRATLREGVRRLRRGLRNINWAHIERAVWLAREGTTGQQVPLAGGLGLAIGYRTLDLTPLPPPSPPGEGGAGGEEVVLAAPGATALGGGRRATVELLAVRPVSLAAPDPWTAYLDAAAVGPMLKLRSRRPGDRFQPLGMGGHSMRLNEFMINAKVPRAQRAGWPVLIGAAGIAWVAGLRLDERAAVRADTAAVWRVALEGWRR